MMGAVLWLSWFPVGAEVTLQQERCGQYGTVDGKYRCIAIAASIINLVATPERYDGKTIQIYGYLDLEFESTAIYLDQKSSPNEGIWLNWGKSYPEWTEETVAEWRLPYNYWRCMYNNKKITVRGTYSMKPDGHMIAAYPGSIHVDNIDDLFGEHDAAREKKCQSILNPKTASKKPKVSP